MGQDRQMHLSNKGREILSHSHGTIISDRVLNLEVITEMERGWQKSRAVPRLILVWGCLAARRHSPLLQDKSGAVLSECLGKCMELRSGINPSKSSDFQGPHCSVLSCSDLMSRKTGANMTSMH